MTHSITSLRRRRRVAGGAAAALLSLGLLTACGSPEPAASGGAPEKERPSAGSSETGAKSGTQVTTQAAAGGVLPEDSLSSLNVALNIGGKRAEQLAEVQKLSVQQQSGTAPGVYGGGTATVVRGNSQSELFSKLIRGEITPATGALAVLDENGATSKRYILKKPRVTKVVNPPSGNAQTVTIKFSKLTVDAP